MGRFATKKVKVSEWPTNSPDLNSIENVQNLLSRAIGHTGKQFQTVANLTNTNEARSCHPSTLKMFETVYHCDKQLKH
uniref:Uncharacterized protein n=1 Tax=Caenorhabditis japonica TaxID=281687 RepID=A0A8R1E7Q0_CAEJA